MARLCNPLLDGAFNAGCELETTKKRLRRLAGEFTRRVLTHNKSFIRWLGGSNWDYVSESQLP